MIFQHNDVGKAFGMKAHVGVDGKTKIIHTAVATAAHVSDPAVLPDLLHG